MPADTSIPVSRVAAKSPMEADLEIKEHGNPIPGPDADAFDAAQRQDRGEPTTKDATTREPSKGTSRSPLEADLEANQRKPAAEKPAESGDDTAQGEGTDSESKPKIGLRNIGPREIRRAADWKQLKTERDQLRQEVDSLRASGKAPAAPGATPDNEEVAALRAERDQYRDIVRQAALERDPEFNRQFDARRQAATEHAKFAAGEKADELAKLLTQPSSPWRDSKIDDLVSELPASAQRRLNAAIGVLDHIDIERSAAIAQNKATWDQRQASQIQEQTNQAQQRQQKLMGTFDNVLREYQRPGDEGIYFYQAKEGDTGHNTAIQESVQIAKDMLAGKLDESDMVRAALIVGASERLFKQMESQETELTQLRAQVAKLRGVDPGTGGRVDIGESARSQRPPVFGEDGDRAYFDAQFEAAQRADRKGRWD